MSIIIYKNPQIVQNKTDEDSIYYKILYRLKHVSEKRVFQKKKSN